MENKYFRPGPIAVRTGPKGRTQDQTGQKKEKEKDNKREGQI